MGRRLAGHALLRIEYAARTDPGRRRKENQDSVLTRADPDTRRYLFVVADGVGGLAGGAAASRITVDVVGLGFDRSAGAGGAAELDAGLQEANRQIMESRNHEGDGAGASTIVALLFGPSTFETAHVGDSRAYLQRGRSLMRLTQDHSLIHEQVRSGILTEEQASLSRQRHVITRSLGMLPRVDVEQRPAESLEHGDAFVLCSDGLTDVVSDDEISEVLAAGAEAEATAARLVDLANARGGPDNISVIVVRVAATD